MRAPEDAKYFPKPGGQEPCPRRAGSVPWPAQAPPRPHGRTPAAAALRGGGRGSRGGGGGSAGPGPQRRAEWREHTRVAARWAAAAGGHPPAMPAVTAPASGQPGAGHSPRRGPAGAFPSPGCGAGAEDAALRGLACLRVPAHIPVPPRDRSWDFAHAAHGGHRNYQGNVDKLEKHPSRVAQSLFTGHPRTSWALPVSFCESPAPRGFSNHFPQGREVPSCEASRTVHSMQRQLPGRAGIPLHRWASLAENLQYQCGLCASNHPMAHATICPQAIPFQELLESWSRHRLLHLITWKIGGGRHSPWFMWTGQRDVVIIRGMCDRRVKRRSNSSLYVWKQALPTATTAPAKARVTTATAPGQAEFGHPPQGTVCFRFPVLKSEFKREKKTPLILF